MRFFINKNCYLNDNLILYCQLTILSIISTINISSKVNKKNYIEINGWKLFIISLNLIPIIIHISILSIYITNKYIIAGIIIYALSTFAIIFLLEHLFSQIFCIKNYNPVKIIINIDLIDRYKVIINSGLIGLLSSILYIFVLSKRFEKYNEYILAKNILLTLFSIIAIFSYTYLQYRRYKFFREIS